MLSYELRRASLKRRARFISKLDLALWKILLASLSIRSRPALFFPDRIRAGSFIFHHTRSGSETKVRLFAILPDWAFDFLSLWTIIDFASKKAARRRLIYEATHSLRFDTFRIYNLRPACKALQVVGAYLRGSGVVNECTSPRFVQLQSWSGGRIFQPICVFPANPSQIMQNLLLCAPARWH